MKDLRIYPLSDYLQSEEELAKGGLPMFGFAVEDFKAILGEVLSYEQMSVITLTANVVGVILENDDNIVSIDHFIQMSIEARCAIIVFDINADTTGFMTYSIRNIFAERFKQYEELKNCYEDRIAFARTEASYLAYKYPIKDVCVVNDELHDEERKES